MVNLADNLEVGGDGRTDESTANGSVVGAEAPSLPPPPPPMPVPTPVHVVGRGLVGGERQKEPRLESAAQAQTDDNGNIIYGPPTIDDYNRTQGILALTGPPGSMEPHLVASRSESCLASGTFGNQSFTNVPYSSNTTVSTTNLEHLDENAHHYVGLVNQAMTCYLNSLIQTLYMTPEFRNAIYSWQFAGTQREEARNIPFQLQRLFLLLQTSEKYSLETKDLTSSFGWESNDAYEQHDVQELCRLMFDALEHKWRNTENQATLIQDLYKGTMEDYVACIKCGTVRAKPDSFLDIPLAVREFGAKESYRSVEEALSAFVKPELLDGDNQYECDKCKSKQNAEKGLRFTQFPYLLTIQLKRFDFDYQTLHRIKLNDRVTFPDILDLNKFLYRERRHRPTEAQKVAARSYANVASTSRSLSQDAIEEEPAGTEVVESEAGAPKRDLWTHWKRGSPEVVDLMKKSGRHVYELFSIMVHQGSASGGHYYCYIKNLSQDRWFCFNDSSVQTASMADVYKTFGGGSGGWSVSNTNAYMLMYRRIDADTNRDFVRSVDLPPHLVELKERVAQEEVERLRQQRELEEMVKVNFFANSSAIFYAKGVDGFETVAEARYMNINRNTSLSDVLETLVGTMFTLEGIDAGAGASPELSRLITCDRYWNMQEAVVDYSAPLSTLMRDGYYPHYRDEVNLVVDTRVRDTFYTFPEREGGKNTSSSSRNLSTLDVIQVVLGEQRMQLEKRICIDTRWSVAELRQALFAVLPESRYPDEESTRAVRIVADHPADDTVQPILLQDDSQSLETIPEIRQIMIQFSSAKAQLLVDSVEVVGTADRVVEEDRKRDFHDSLLFKIIDARKHRMRLKIVLPNKVDYQHVGMVWRDVELPELPRPLINLPSPRLLAHTAAPQSARVPHNSGSTSGTPAAMEGCQPPAEFSASLSVGDAPHSLSSLDECTVAATVPLMVEPGQGSPTSSSSNDSNDDHPMEQGSAFCDDEQMDVSSMSTPKRSPVVSDASEGESEEAPFLKHAKSGGGAEHEGIGWRQAEINSKLERLIEESSAMRRMGPIGREHGEESLSMHNSNTVVTSIMSATSHHNLRPSNNKGKDGSTGGGDQETVYGGESTTTDSTTPSTSTIKAVVESQQPPSQPEEGEQDPASGPYQVAVVRVNSVDAEQQKSDEYAAGELRPWIEIEVDRRQLCSDLKRWLANYLQIRTDSFHLYKHYSDLSDGYGCFSSSPAAIRDTFSSINHLSVRLNVARSESEQPLPIHRFERTQPDLQKWPLLFYIAVAAETTVGEVLARCRDLLHTVYGLPPVHKVEQLRLRDFTERGAVALKRGEKLEVRGMAWSKPLYLEVIEDEDATSWPNEERSVPVMVIQWCPASADVKPLGELQLRVEVQGEAKALRKLIAQHTTLPVERIQLSEPCPTGANNQWVKWPFTRSTLDLIDGLVKFHAENPSLPLDGSYGGKVVYFKDSNEFAKSVSEEERKTIKIRESARTSAVTSTSFIHKRERPLRIQMHSICESDP